MSRRPPEATLSLRRFLALKIGPGVFASFRDGVSWGSRPCIPLLQDHFISGWDKRYLVRLSVLTQGESGWRWLEGSSSVYDDVSPRDIVSGSPGHASMTILQSRRASTRSPRFSASTGKKKVATHVAIVGGLFRSTSSAA